VFCIGALSVQLILTLPSTQASSTFSAWLGDDVAACATAGVPNPVSSAIASSDLFSMLFPRDSHQHLSPKPGTDLDAVGAEKVESEFHLTVRVKIPL
jgi:hypothetical protein